MFSDITVNANCHLRTMNDKYILGRNLTETVTSTLQPQTSAADSSESLLLLIAFALYCVMALGVVIFELFVTIKMRADAPPRETPRRKASAL